MTVPVEADALACELSVVTPVEDQLKWLIGNLGSRLTAASVGEKYASVLRGWAAGNEIDETHLFRIRLLYRVSRAIAALYSDVAVVSGFLRGSNYLLNDEAPMVIIANWDPALSPKTENSIISALRAFLVG